MPRIAVLARAEWNGRGPRPAAEREYRAGNPHSTRYDYREEDLVADDAVLRLITDPTLGAVADAYLGMQAIEVRGDMWRSIPHPEGASSEAAQMFHADRDHARTLKFFVYLTDVDPTTGPHVFVRRSRRARSALREDRRFTDEEVTACYGADAVIELCGPAGTLLAADTSGLHKGQHPAAGPRLVVGVQYASGRHGVRVGDYVVDPADDDVSARIRARRRRFQRFRLADQ
jgi:hypothetical protein